MAENIENHVSDKRLESKLKNSYNSIKRDK